MLRFGTGCVCSHSHPLNASRQEDPHAGNVRETQVHQFVHQSVGEDNVDRRATLHKEQPHKAPTGGKEQQGGLQLTNVLLICLPYKQTGGTRLRILLFLVRVVFLRGSYAGIKH